MISDTRFREGILEFEGAGKGEQAFSRNFVYERILEHPAILEDTKKEELRRKYEELNPAEL